MRFTDSLQHLVNNLFLNMSCEADKPPRIERVLMSIVWLLTNQQRKRVTGPFSSPEFRRTGNEISSFACFWGRFKNCTENVLKSDFCHGGSDEGTCRRGKRGERNRCSRGTHNPSVGNECKMKGDIMVEVGFGEDEGE